MSRYSTHVRLAIFGALLGAGLSAAGFTDYGELHRMFTFTDVRLLLTFAAAVVAAGIAFAVRCRGGKIPRQQIRKGTVPGALLFGAGWALCGGCPGALLAQIGEGKLFAFLTLGGVLAGTVIGQRIKARLGWDPGSCAM